MSSFPLAIRARLSTENSESDSSSFTNSDDNESKEESEEEEEDNAISLMQPFMPIARITGDEEDDNVTDELLFDVDDDVDDVEEEKDDNFGDFVDDIAVEQNKGFELELKDLAVESSIGDSEKNNLAGDFDSTQNLVIQEGGDEGVEIVKVESFVDFGEEAMAAGDIDSKNGVLGEEMVGDAEVEADCNESEGFEPKFTEVCAVNMEVEKDEDCSGKLIVLAGSDDDVYGNHSPSKDVSAEKMTVYRAHYLDDFKEKNDESVVVVKENCITENCDTCESDKFSSFYAFEKEMESRFDYFHFTHDEDEHAISEWPAMFAISENSEFVKHIMKEMEEGSSTSQSYSNILGGKTTSNSDKGRETDEDDNAKELFDTSSLAAHLRASSGAFSGGVAHFTSRDESPVNGMNDEEKMLHSKVEQIRTKYLRIVEKLGHSADDTLPDHVLRRMSLINPVRPGRKISEEFSLEIAKKLALQLDEGKHDFTFSCTILVLGKTGVGKSSIINSIFGEEKAFTDPFQPAKTSVREISGVVDGVYLRFIDTPGLLSPLNDQRANRKILSSIKKYARKCPPDVVLYVDRLDVYNRDFDDLPLLRMITHILGSSIWFNAIIALTHADSAFPDEPEGSSMSYEVVVVQRSMVVQQSIWLAAEDNCLGNSVALVENHPSCRNNIDGESILLNGLRWKPWLLLLCYSFKILSEVNSLMKFKISSSQKLFPFHSRYPFPIFLSSIMHSKVHSKYSTNQEGDSSNYDSDIDLESMTEEAQEEEENKFYFDECDHKLKLLQKKKCKEELKTLKKMKGGKGGQDEQEANPAVVAIPLPDIALPPSLDDQNPTHLYRFLEPRSRHLTRQVQRAQSWDHDYDYDSAKDRKEFIIYLDSSIEPKIGEIGSTLASFNIQPVEKQLASSLQCAANLKNMTTKKKKIATGILVSGKTLKIQMNTVYGMNLDVCFREQDYPFGEGLSSSLVLSMLKWRDFSLGVHFQSQFSTGLNSNGQISIRLAPINRFILPFWVCSLLFFPFVGAK